MGLISHLFLRGKKNISVNVRLACIIKAKPINTSMAIELPEGSTINSLLKELESRINEQLPKGITVLLNGERIDPPGGLKREINAGDNISIISPIAGGSQDILEGSFTSFDGTRLFFREWKIENPSANILIVHGLGEHSGRYIKLAGDFNKAGFSVFSFDLRGHGRSEGKRGHIMSFNEYLYDLDNFEQMLIKRSPRPLFLLGHSMGGLIAMNFALKNPSNLRGLITSSPLLKIKAKVPEWKKKLGVFLSNRIPSLSMSNGLNPDHLSHDRDIVIAYKKDPLVHTKVTARWFTEITSAMEETRNLAHRLSLPVLMLHAGSDLLTDPEGSKEIFSLIKVKDKELKIYDGYYHEIYNELEREKPINDTIEWIKRRSSTPS